MKSEPLIYGIPDYTELARAIAGHARGELGNYEYRQFPDGERYLRLLDSLVDRDVVVVGGTIHDTALLDLYDIASGAVALGCRRMSFVIPFFGYSTMERAVKPGEVVTAKTRARLLSSVPRAPQGNRVFLLDLHSEGIPYYFEREYLPHHVYGKPLILEAAKKLGEEAAKKLGEEAAKKLGEEAAKKLGEEAAKKLGQSPRKTAAGQGSSKRSGGERGFVLGSVDAGRAKWVESLANDLEVEARFILKRRKSDRRTSVIAVSGSVEGRKVIIYDDMIRTGGSLLSAARAYLDQGATEVCAIATHGLFPEDSLSQIRSSGLIAQIVCTDSHPRACALQREHRGFLSLISVSKLLAQALTEERSS